MNMNKTTSKLEYSDTKDFKIGDLVFSNDGDDVDVVLITSDVNTKGVFKGTIVHSSYDHSFMFAWSSSFHIDNFSRFIGTITLESK